MIPYFGWAEQNLRLVVAIRTSTRTHVASFLCRRLRLVVFHKAMARLADVNLRRQQRHLSGRVGLPNHL